MYVTNQINGSNKWTAKSTQCVDGILRRQVVVLIYAHNVIN